MVHVIGDNDSNLLFGGDSADLLEGKGDNDLLLGLKGNDTLIGGAGTDALNGGDGFDTIDYIGSTAVIVDLQSNAAAGGDAFGDGFTSIEAVAGTNEQDFITGNAAANHLFGRDGNDLINGRDSSDLIFGGNGDDTLNGGDGDDDLVGEAGADSLNGGFGFDDATYLNSTIGFTIDLGLGRGFGGDAQGDRFTSIEAILGSHGSDTLIGSGTAEKLEGGEGGFDHVEGRGGDDRLNASGFLAGGGGNDTVIGGFFFGSQLSGGGGQDSMVGGSFADTVNGGDGLDRVLGGGGGDLLAGGAQADQFAYFSVREFTPGANMDLIVDFHRTDGDKLDVSEIDADETSGETTEAFRFIGNAAFDGHAGELRFASNARQQVTFVQGDTDGDRAPDLQIKLTGIIAFTASDFILAI